MQAGPGRLRGSVVPGQRSRTSHTSRHVLVKQHADEQSERALLQEGVGFGVIGDIVA
jgi:hypothetical protein